jgi:hypothetical protein
VIQFLEFSFERIYIDRQILVAVRASMSNGKDQHVRPSNGDDQPDRQRSSVAAGRSPGAVPNEQQGWEAYRKWLSRVSMQPARRSPRDVSIYSWRGYNNWADKVRQNWESDES